MESEPGRRWKSACRRAWGSGFKQATACEPGRCDSGFETDWRPCASGPDKEGVRLARAMLRSSPCHGSKPTSTSTRQGRARPGAGSDDESLVRSGEADQCPRPALHAGRTLQSERHWLCASTAPCRPPSSANPGWAVTGPVTVISQNTPARAAAFAIAPPSHPPVCHNKAPWLRGSLQCRIPTLSLFLARLPVEELGHTGFRHQSRLPFCLLLDPATTLPNKGGEGAAHAGGPSAAAADKAVGDGIPF
ncbi:hypothetical protein COCVIDRAFT_41655 [Bipolaris victoriae FI3]|uniref:Uncharacterized protein n=1 Tax=Bipolaris victoriae (strain FI3) TaxID=930091 RepID=W7E9E5_BIPV3|nr:hypothetical protein COCVIDRAFT_41655 [Bipolaris victoriae FI3]